MKPDSHRSSRRKLGRYLLKHATKLYYYQIKLANRNDEVRRICKLHILRIGDKWILVKTVITFVFQKMWEIYWLAEKLLPCQEGLCCMELSYRSHMPYLVIYITCTTKAQMLLKFQANSVSKWQQFSKIVI